MNLINFEYYMDRIIFDRGLDYYEHKYVLSLEAKEDNVYEAEVEGTELYNVRVELNELKNIIDINCDCPYDMGPYCKHQAAVLLALRDKDHITVDNNSLPPSQTHFNVSHDLEATLTKRTKEELIAFLLNIAADSDEIEQRLALHFNDSNDEDELKLS